MGEQKQSFDLADTVRLRELIERRYRAYLWGQPEIITPRLVDAVFGDGLKLIYIEPLMTRPNYYAVRVDSAADFKSDEWFDELEGEEGIYEAIAEQFDEHTDGCRHCDHGETKLCEFPIAWLDEGTSWGELKIDEFIQREKRALRRKKARAAA